VVLVIVAVVALTVCILATVYFVRRRGRDKQVAEKPTKVYPHAHQHRLKPITQFTPADTIDGRLAAGIAGVSAHASSFSATEATRLGAQCKWSVMSFARALIGVVSVERTSSTSERAKTWCIK
jgi:hypothetical protein